MNCHILKSTHKLLNGCVSLKHLWKVSFGFKSRDGQNSFKLRVIWSLPLWQLQLTTTKHPSPEKGMKLQFLVFQSFSMVVT